MGPKGGGGGGGGMNGGAVGKTRLFAVEGGEFDSREATISSLFFYNFAECMHKTKKERALFQRRDIKC